MNLSRFWWQNRFTRMCAVARLEFLHVLHDRPTLALIFTGPAIQIILFGYAVNFNPTHIPLVIAGAQVG